MKKRKKAKKFVMERFGILNRFKEPWTDRVFFTPEGAELHVKNFLGENYEPENFSIAKVTMTFFLSIILIFSLVSVGVAEDCKKWIVPNESFLSSYESCRQANALESIAASLAKLSEEGRGA